MERNPVARQSLTVTKPKRSPLAHEVDDCEDDLMVEELPVTTKVDQQLKQLPPNAKLLENALKR